MLIYDQSCLLDPNEYDVMDRGGPGPRISTLICFIHTGPGLLLNGIVWIQREM